MAREKIQFSLSVMSDSLLPHGLQHTRLPCPSPTPGWSHTQTHVHRVADAIQPSHPLSPPSAFVFNLSQHQGLFHRVGFSHQMAKVLELKLQNQSFQWIFRVDSLQGDWFDLLAVQGTLKRLLSTEVQNMCSWHHSPAHFHHHFHDHWSLWNT